MQNSPHPLKVKPTHYSLSATGKWLHWPYGEIVVAALKKHDLGKPKNVQGLLVHSLYGGLKAAGTYWHWDCNEGFTEGVYAYGSTPK